MPEHDQEGFALRLDRFDELTAAKGWNNDKRRADGLGVSHTTVARIRRGESQPGARFIATATTVLGVSVEDLFTQLEVTR